MAWRDWSVPEAWWGVDVLGTDEWSRAAIGRPMTRHAGMAGLESHAGVMGPNGGSQPTTGTHAPAHRGERSSGQVERSREGIGAPAGRGNPDPEERAAPKRRGQVVVMRSGRELGATSGGL